MIKIKNHFWREVVGISLIIVGILGLFLPVIPGWIFIIAGLIVLKVHFLKEFFKKLKKKGIIRNV
ncbi:hypothetical protein HZC32_03910 [Candidatus Woesearchaeota archaeon]|nr:hypothetical protein [Candidatus Woesearchaeota archaeon]